MDTPCLSSQKNIGPEVERKNKKSCMISECQSMQDLEETKKC